MDRMNTITRMGTFDKLVKQAPKDVAEICWVLRALIAALHPDAFRCPLPESHRLPMATARRQCQRSMRTSCRRRPTLFSAFTTEPASLPQARAYKGRARLSGTSKCAVLRWPNPMRSKPFFWLRWRNAGLRSSSERPMTEIGLANSIRLSAHLLNHDHSPVQPGDAGRSLPDLRRVATERPRPLA